MKQSLEDILKDALIGRKVRLSSMTDMEEDHDIIVEITDCVFDEKAGDDDDKFVFYRLPDGGIEQENLDWSDELDFVEE